ncbi:MAG: hypothetical protein IJP83_00965 [Mycoplasma sp.]|nr:hypothetical protein [Mycoplasma sp.]
MKQKAEQIYENSTYKRKVNVLLSEDNYALITYYSMVNDVSIESALSSFMEYTIRMLKNGLRHHANSNDKKNVLETIINEVGLDINQIKSNKKIFDDLMNYTEKICEKRYEFSPFERTYWYEILKKVIESAKKITLISKKSKEKQIN